MGADLIINFLVIDKDKTPDLDAGFIWAETANVADLAQGYEQYHGDFLTETDGDSEPYLNDETTYTEAGEQALREHVKGLVSKLRDDVLSVGDPSTYGPRDMAVLDIRGVRIYLSGGMSWGDAPTDAGAIMSELWDYPGLLEAVGFDLAVD